MKNNLEELKATLESIRSEKYPHIPQELINEIINIQHENKDNDVKRERETKKAIKKYANQIDVG